MGSLCVTGWGTAGRCPPPAVPEAPASASCRHVSPPVSDSSCPGGRRVRWGLAVAIRFQVFVKTRAWPWALGRGDGGDEKADGKHESCDLVGDSDVGRRGRPGSAGAVSLASRPGTHAGGGPFPHPAHCPSR